MQQTTSRLWSRNFVFIILINFLVFLNHIMLLSTFPFYVEHLGGTEAQAGLAAFFFSLIAVIVRPVVGLLLDSGKRKSIMFIGMCGMILMPMGYILVSTVNLLIMLRMIQGAALAFANTGINTAATDMIPRDRFTEGMGMFGTAIALATACAPTLGLFLKDHFGFTVLFFVAAALVFTSLILMLTIPCKSKALPRPAFSLKNLFEPNAIPASVVVLPFLLTFGALENFLAKYAATKPELPSGGVYFAVMSATLLLMRLTIGKVADRKGESIFVYSCNITMLLAFFLLAFFPNTFTFFLSAVLAGYGYGGIEPALNAMAVRSAPPERRGSANSTFLCAFDIGMGLGGGVAGALISSLGYTQMFTIVPLANVLSFALYFFWARKHPSAFHGN